MTTFVDTSVLIPLLSPGAEHHAWCAAQVAQVDRPLAICDIVYAEVSVAFKNKHDVDLAMRQLDISRVPLSDDVLFRAGKAFLQYKENNGPRDSLLPDFLIGAQAEVEGEPLLTRDPSRVTTYFPHVNMIRP